MYKLSMGLSFVAMVLFAACSSDGVEEAPYSLDGINMTYKYTEGNAYNVKFENDSVSYRYLTGSSPKTWWGPFKYNAVKRSNGEYFLSWYEHGYGDIVTLLLNSEKMEIWGSALIAKKDRDIVHFQKAKISEFRKE